MTHLNKMFKFLIVSFLFVAGALQAQPASKKNVLFIAIDDLKPNLGCYGDSLALSPNIDRLAEQASVFANNQCQQAICGPSRASLLTGWRPDKTQIWDLHTLIRDKNPDVVTLPQYFKNNGYETAATGKVFDPRSVDSGHDTASWSIPYVLVTAKRWQVSTGRPSTESADLPDSDYVDGKIARVGMQLLEKVAKGDKPFFVAVGFKKPHLPFVAPKKYWDLYNRDSIQINPFQKHAKNSPDYVYTKSGEFRSYDDVPDEGEIPVDVQKRAIHGYYACVSFVDAQVQKVIAKLDSLGLRKNTVIIIWGDHGWHLGDHAQWAKHTNFEQATRAPMIIVDPDYPQKRYVTTPTEFVDIYPTLCDLVGLPIPKGLAGVSLKPIISGQSNRVKDYAMSQYKKSKYEGYTIRTDRYRYTEWLPVEYREGTLPYSENIIVDRELYDYKIDPRETYCFVFDSAYQRVVDSLHSFLSYFLIHQFDNGKPPEDTLGNLILNPDFENGLESWKERACKLSVETTIVQNGAKAVKVYDRTSSWGGPSQIITDGLSRAGKGKYLFSGYFRSASLKDSAKAVIRIKAGGETNYFHLSAEIDSVGWTHLADTLMLTWNGSLEAVRLALQTIEHQDITFYVDNLSLRKDTTITSVEDNGGEILPSKFSLKSYPNPFNPVATISFSLPVNSRVTLNVYDVLGRKVASLVNGRKQAGNYSVKFNASSLTSGVYVCRLRTERYSKALKILLVK